MSLPRQTHEPQPSKVEVWSAIHYLEAPPQRGIADLMISVFLCWLILFASALYVSAQLRR